MKRRTITLIALGAVFVIVGYDLTNDGKETETVMTDDFKVMDGEGRVFRSSSKATTAIAMLTDQDLLLTEVQPGLTREMLTAFEVAEDAARAGLTLVIKEKGLFGSGEVRVTLPVLEGSLEKKRRKKK